MTKENHRADNRTQEGISVAVLTCGGLGFEVANRLTEATEVREVTLLTTPYRTDEETVIKKLTRTLRYDGVPGICSAMGRRLKRLFRSMPTASNENHDLRSSVVHYSFENFHSEECIDTIKGLAPDLGVLAGVYILKERVFAIPDLGSINLHTGKVPEYRGSAPGFWELYNGETEVGITVHEVTSDVDAGAVLREETRPLNPIPSGDPLEYIHSYREEVLHPAGIEALVQVVKEFAAGEVAPRPQQGSAGRTYPKPLHSHKKELRRRVRRRRREKQ